MKVCVLIVEDEKLIRWSLRQKFEARGYTVTDVENGEQAFEKQLVDLHRHLRAADGAHHCRYSRNERYLFWDNRKLVKSCSGKDILYENCHTIGAVGNGGGQAEKNQKWQGEQRTAAGCNVEEARDHADGHKQRKFEKIFHLFTFFRNNDPAHEIGDDAGQATRQKQKHPKQPDPKTGNPRPLSDAASHTGDVLVAGASE